jgi:hypothetical protein
MAAALITRLGAGESSRSSIFGAGIKMSCFSDFALEEVAITVSFEISDPLDRAEVRAGRPGLTLGNRCGG